MDSPAPALLIIVFIALMAGCAYFAIPPILAITNSYGRFDVDTTPVVQTPPVVKSGVDAMGSSASLTAGWKTYRNDIYQFEIQIPRTWDVKTRDSNMLELLNTQQTYFLEGSQIAPIRILLYQNKNGLDIDNLIKSKLYLPYSPSGNAVRGKINLFGKDFIQIKNVYTGLVYETLSKNTIFQFEFLAGEAQEKEIFHKILSTFKFIK